MTQAFCKHGVDRVRDDCPQCGPSYLSTKVDEMTKPMPPLAKREVMVEYIFRDTRDGEFWIDIDVNGKPYQQLGPFDTATERQRAHDDLLGMVRSLGGKDVPAGTQ